jgi:outer membrane protein OmpA-like peptidoglycan-associated protein
MRSFANLRATPLLLAAIAVAGPASAQVTVDLHALQALPARPASPPSPRPVRVVPPTPPASVPMATARPAETAPSAATQASTAPQSRPPTPPAPTPALPDQMPQTASINPVAPPADTAPPPPPPVSPQAATAAAPTQAGLRLTFADGQSDLSPDSAAAIKQFAAAAPPGGTATFNVQAYAPGKPDDPSSARRLSLARAMAARTALVSDGIASARIFVRALGTQYGSGPPDRVDIDVTGDNAAAAR